MSRKEVGCPERRVLVVGKVLIQREEPGPGVHERVCGAGAGTGTGAVRVHRGRCEAGEELHSHRHGTPSCCAHVPTVVDRQGCAWLVQLHLTHYPHCSVMLLQPDVLSTGHAVRPVREARTWTAIAWASGSGRGPGSRSGGRPAAEWVRADVRVLVTGCKQACRGPHAP